MGAFRSVLDELEMREISLQGRRFTWSNDTTQTRIDRTFCTTEWDLMIQSCSLQALSSLVSDHCPLLLVGNTDAKKYSGFRFQVFWPNVQGYQEVVQQAWERGVTTVNPFLRLHIKLQRTGAKLRQWSKSKIGNVKLLLCAAKQLIGILDVVQEFRQLSVLEVRLKCDLKACFLGLIAVEKIRAKQQSRIRGIKAADAQTKLFFMQINGRKRKNYIKHLLTEEGQVHTHTEKEQHIFYHFSKKFGPPVARQFTLDWDRLGLPSHDLSALEDEFTEQEVHAVIKEIAADKAPGPDGYIGAFYKESWQLIKDDLLAAINYFYNQHE